MNAHAPPRGEWLFGPFRLDLPSGRLLRGIDSVPLRPKTWRVLCHLVENAGRLISKEELLDAVWTGCVVSDTMPSVCVAELRRALGDDPRTPRYIETSHSRGFRFIAPIEIPPSIADTARGSRTPASLLIGRDVEMAALRKAWERGGGVVFVTGEAGIGKSSLVTTFQDKLLRSEHGWVVGYGRCSSHYGEGDPYLPFLDAFMALAGERPDLREKLRTTAPNWHSQLFPESLEVTVGTNPTTAEETPASARMRSECSRFLSSLGRCLLVLDDMHWADPASVELLGYLGESPQRHGATILVTYRPGDAIAEAHPVVALKRDLSRRDKGVEIPLAGLEPGAVHEYLRTRVPDIEVPAWLAARLEAHTDGNPFFLGASVESLEIAGALDAESLSRESIEVTLREVPETLRDMLELQLERLRLEDRRMLACASVAGEVFDAAATAAGLDMDVHTVDERLDALARAGTFTRRRGERTWPDGTTSGRYAFLHALYRQILYESVPPAVRRDQHRAIGTALALAYGPRSVEVSAEIADHFERGFDLLRAAEFHRLAARAASFRFASREVVLHLQKALELHRKAPSARVSDEIDMLTELGKSATMLEGFDGPVAREAYARARSLSVAAESPDLTALAGLCHVQIMQHDITAAEASARQLVERTRDSTSVVERAQAVLLLGSVRLHQGDVVEALKLQMEVLDLDVAPVYFGPLNLTAAALGAASTALWMLGRPAEAAARAEEALEACGEDDHPFNHALVLQAATVVKIWSGQMDDALSHAERLLELSASPDLADFASLAKVLRARAAVDLEPAPESPDLAEALAVAEAVAIDPAEKGALINHNFVLCNAAEILASCGRRTTAMELLRHALDRIEGGTERYYEAEIHRVLGTLLAAGDAQQREQGLRHLKTALAIASRRGLRGFEARARASLEAA